MNDNGDPVSYNDGVVIHGLVLFTLFAIITLIITYIDNRNRELERIDVVTEVMANQ